MNFSQDSSVQTNTALSVTGTTYKYVNTNDLSTKQDLLSTNTNLLGIGTSITALNYNNITLNKPTNFQCDYNSTLINKPTNFQCDYNTTLINKPTNFQCDYNSTLINKPTNFQCDYNTTLINKPDLNVYAVKANVDASLNNVYTKSYIDTSFNNVYTKSYIDTSFNNVYTKSYIDTSFNNVYTKANTDTLLNTKQNIITAVTPLIKDISNNLTIDLSAYPLKTYVDGSLNTINTTLSQKQNIITAITPLIKDVSNNITIDLSAYPLKSYVDGSLNTINTTLSQKQNIITAVTPLIKDVSNNITIDLSAYPLKSYVDGSLNTINTTLSTKQNTITAVTPLKKDVSNNITIDLSAYPLKTYVDGSLNTINTTLLQKQNIITAVTPLIKDVSNNITIDLSAYPLKSYVDGSLNTINTTLSQKQNIITAITPLIKDVSNNLSIDLSAYPLKTYVDGSLNTINTTLSTKQNNITVSTPLIKDVSNNITIDLSGYVINTNLNVSNVTSGTLSISRGGIGTTTLTSGQILIGNASTSILQSANLTWNNTSNTLSATNFIGSGTGISALNASNITSGTLTVSRGGIGATTLTANQILIGNGTSALLQSANLTWNNTSNTLSATNFIGSGTGITNLDYNNISLNKPVLTFNNPLLNTSNTISLKINSAQFNIDSSGNLSLVSSYLPLSGGTLTGNLSVANNINITGATTSPQSLFFRSTDYNLGIAGGTGNYSYYAVQNDMILRTLTGTNLYLQSGGNTHALKIDANNNVSITNTLSATTIQEGGTNLSLKYLQLSGGTLTGNLIINSSPPNIQFSTTNGHNLGVAVTAGNFSSSAAIGDMVLRSINNLILQSGSGTYGLKIDSNNYIYVNKNLSISTVSTDTRAVVESRIFSSGSTITSAFGGDTYINSYWGVAIGLNYGGATNGYGGGNNTQSIIPSYSAFTVNLRSSTSATSYDKNLFTILPNGQLTIQNDIWHQSSDGILRLFFQTNGTSFFHSGNTNGDGFVFRNTAQGDILTIRDSGNITVAGIMNLNGDNLQFPNTLNQYKINLYGSNSYGFGIAASTLMYSSQSYHKFYNSTNSANTMTLDGNGNLSTSGTISSGGNITCSGTITNGSTSYIYAGGLRIGGFDTGNTIFQSTGNIGITCNNGYNISFITWLGNGTIMSINNTSVNTYQPTTINSTLTANHFYCTVKTLNFTSITEGGSGSTLYGFFLSLNNWWYLGYTYLTISCSVTMGGQNIYCWNGRVFLSPNGSSIKPTGGVLSIIEDYVNPSSGPYKINAVEKWDGVGNNYLHFYGTFINAGAMYIKCYG